MQNYVSCIAHRLVMLLFDYDLDPDLVFLYALLVLVKGDEVTLEDVHRAWSVRMCSYNPNHVSLVPFSELSLASQELGRPFLEAIHQVSKEM